MADDPATDRSLDGVLVPAAQVEAMMRMLVDSGDATPMALHMMQRITRSDPRR